MYGWKLWIRRVVAVVVFVVALVLALVGAIVTPYFVAGWSANITVLAILSVLAFGLIVWFGSRICAVLWKVSRGGRSAAVSTGIFTLLFAVVLYITVLRPSVKRLPDAPPFENTQYWELSTGSRIAYREFGPVGGTPVKPYPIIYVHGGPGMSQGQFDQDFYHDFTSLGLRVYLYDQAGSGLSDFLPVRKYSIPQAVEDLEAIRQKLGAEKLILIGHSWGSTLAASYMAKYPGHVAKVVFHSPGPLWYYFHEEKADYTRTDLSGKTSFPSLRLLAAMELGTRNPDAGENLLPQSEAEQLLSPMVAPIAGALVCKGDFEKLPQSIKEAVAGRVKLPFNPYVRFRYALETEQPAGDPHQKLRGNATPAILLFPECNYLPWIDVDDYRKTFANLKVYYVPRAGHFVQFEQPDLMRRIITAFLLDQPDVIPAYTSDLDPRLTKK